METAIKIQELKNDFKIKEAKELSKLNLEIEGIKRTGLKCIAIDENWLKFDNLESLKDVKVILKSFKPSKENAKVTFSGKDAIQTESPFLLSLSNYTHIKDDKYLQASLKYKTNEGFVIWIKLSKDILKFNCQQKQVNPNSRAKYPEMYSFFTVHNLSGLKSQYYYGGSITYYGTKEQFKQLLNL